MGASPDLIVSANDAKQVRAANLQAHFAGKPLLTPIPS